MVKHIVMFKFLPNADGRSAAENAEMTKKMLEELQGVIPTLISSKVRLNSEKADPSNCELILESDFESFEGLHEYIVHPAHKAVGAFMKPLRESRSCVDYEY